MCSALRLRHTWQNIRYSGTAAYVTPIMPTVAASCGATEGGRRMAVEAKQRLPGGWVGEAPFGPCKLRIRVATQCPIHRPAPLTMYQPWSVTFLFTLLYRSWRPRGRLLKRRAAAGGSSHCCCCDCRRSCCHAACGDACGELPVQLCSQRRSAAASSGAVAGEGAAAAAAARVPPPRAAEGHSATAAALARASRPADSLRPRIPGGQLRLNAGEAGPGKGAAQGRLERCELAAGRGSVPGLLGPLQQAPLQAVSRGHVSSQQLLSRRNESGLRSCGAHTSDRDNRRGALSSAKVRTQPNTWSSSALPSSCLSDAASLARTAGTSMGVA